MFPTPSKVTRLWLLPTVALTLMLLVYAAFAFSSAKAQPSGTPPGDYCVEGIVINWKEEPLAGWTINLSGTTISGATNTYTTTSAEEPDEDEKDPDFQKGEFEFKDIPEEPGTYTATIQLQEGWGGVTSTSFTFDINEGEDDCVQIRFKVAPQIPVTVYKIDANHNPLEDWKIKVVPGPGNLFASPDEDTTDISGTVVFTLTPGLWYFMEMSPKTDEGDPQEAYMPVVPPNGRQQLDIKEEDYNAGLTVVFKNELVVGCVLVRKVSVLPTSEVDPQQIVDPTNGLFNVAGWGIKLLRKDGTVARQGVTDAKGEIRFDGLPLGPYIVVEEERPGWSEAGGTLTQQEINITGNNCEDPFLFYNLQDDSGYCIEGRKLDANGGYGIPDWEIKIKPLDEGGYDPDNVLTDGLGKFTINFPMDDYRIPGAKYEICEEDVDGWLPHTATCQTVQLPEWPGACVQMKDFVNQQVGHSESEKMGGMWGGPMDGGPSMGGGMGMSCSSYHIAKPGEGLYDIGRMYNKSAQEMLNANPDIKNSAHQWVIIGQKVCIP